MSDDRSVTPDLPALLSAVTPEMYRRNPFQLLRLPPTAAPNVVRKQGAKLAILEKFGTTATPAASPDELRDAATVLDDPHRRIVAELLWFWPGPDGDDVALGTAALADRDGASVASRWRTVKSGAAGYPAALHNLAVLHHALALRDGAAGGGRRSDRAAWASAMQAWDAAIRDRGTWDWLGERVLALDDPRLRLDDVDRLLATLPVALLSLNVTMAVGAMRAGRLEEADVHAAVIRDSPFGQHATEGAFRRVLGPDIGALRALLVEAEQGAERDPTTGAEAARRIVRESASVLALLDRFLGEGHSLRDGTHDDVAKAGLSCQIEYGNKTNDWVTSKELLELVAPIAVSPVLRERVQRNLETVSRNLRGVVCFFCEKRPGEAALGWEFEMFGNVRRTPTDTGVRINWEHSTVQVLRCPQCREHHRRQRVLQPVRWLPAGLVLGAVVGFVFGMFAWSSFDPAAKVAWGGLFAGVGGLLAALIAALASFLMTLSGIKPTGRRKEHPRIKELLADGWKFGKEPAG
jgi:hypothetical protein